MELKYEKEELLEALRELTTLGPIAQIKIKKAHLLANKLAIKNKKANPYKKIDVDYSLINNLEIQLRMVELAKSLKNLWEKYTKVGEYTSGLSDYVSDYLNQYIDNKKNEKTIKM